MKNKVAVIGSPKNSASLFGIMAAMGAFPTVQASARRFTEALPALRAKSITHTEGQACARRRRQIERGILKKENGLIAGGKE